MPTLTSRNLQPGDLMLKFSDGGTISNAIQIGQLFTGFRHHSIVHAGILFDNHYIIEAQGSGISANDLRIQDKKFGYMVFRPRQTQIGQGAATCAKMMLDIHHEHNTLKYNLTGAVASLSGKELRRAQLMESRGAHPSAVAMDRLLDDVLSGKGRPFFCSQFVVYVYQFVAAQCGLPASRLFPVEAAKVPPALLATLLDGSTTFVKVGHLPPGRR